MMTIQLFYLAPHAHSFNTPPTRSAPRPCAHTHRAGPPNLSYAVNVTYAEPNLCSQDGADCGNSDSRVEVLLPAPQVRQPRRQEPSMPCPGPCHVGIPVAVVVVLLER